MQKVPASHIIRENEVMRCSILMHNFGVALTRSKDLKREIDKHGYEKCPKSDQAWLEIQVMRSSLRTAISEADQFFDAFFHRNIHLNLSQRRSEVHHGNYGRSRAAASGA